MPDTPHPQPPRSFRLSRGPSDLGALFFALAFGLFLIIAPLAARWLYRALLVALIILLFGLIRSLRRLRTHAPPRRPLTTGDHLSTALALVILSLWIWHIAHVYIAGRRIDATLAALLVTQAICLRWLSLREAQRDDTSRRHP